jgi:hypothetical protein
VLLLDKDKRFQPLRKSNIHSTEQLGYKVPSANIINLYMMEIINEDRELLLHPDPEIQSILVRSKSTCSKFNQIYRKE